LRNVGIPRTIPLVATVPTMPTIRRVSDDNDAVEEEMHEYNFQSERMDERNVEQEPGGERKQRQDSGHSMSSDAS
jgi:hypothetical protein